MARIPARLRWRAGLVDNRQSLVEEFPKHDPLTQAGRNPETDTFRQALQQTRDIAFVTGIDMGQAIAHDDPVDRCQAFQYTPVALFPYQLGVNARGQDLASLYVDRKRPVFPTLMGL